MNTSFWKKSFVLAGLAMLPLLASAQEKATIAVASVKPTPSLAKSVKEAATVSSTSQSGSQMKTQVTHVDPQEELGRIVESLDSQLIDRINATRKFTVVSRSDLSDVIKEQDLDASGNVDAKTAAKTGKLAGAKYLLVATVDDFQDYLERAVFEGTGQTATKRVFRLSVVAKIYNSSTGKLLESANFQTGNDEFKKIQMERSYTVKTGMLSDEMMVAVARNMAEKIAVHVANIIFPIKVLIRRDNIVTINRGQGGGVDVGDVFDVYAQGQELKDPDTGEILGREEVKVGKVKITQVDPKMSQAEILEDSGIDKGAVLRKAQTQEPAKQTGQ